MPTVDTRLTNRYILLGHWTTN